MSITGPAYRSPPKIRKSLSLSYQTWGLYFKVFPITILTLFGGHNARNTKWWRHDIITIEGIQLGTTTTI